MGSKSYRLNFSGEGLKEFEGLLKKVRLGPGDIFKIGIRMVRHYVDSRIQDYNNSKKGKEFKGMEGYEVSLLDKNIIFEIEKREKRMTKKGNLIYIDDFFKNKG